MVTIAISNEKGGVAKTTTTVSLGASLSEIGVNVLLIDTDPQANLSLALGIEVNHDEPSTATVLMESIPIKSAIHKTPYKNLDILPANSDMGQVEYQLSGKPDYASTFRRILRNSSLDYDTLLIDCPPMLGAVTRNSLAAADLLLIPTQAEYFSIYGLRNLMSAVQQLRSQINPRLSYRLLLTMYDMRNRTHRILHQQLRETFRSGVMETVITTDTKLRESSVAGVPITFYAPKSRAAQQYRALAQEMSEYVKKATLQPA